MSSRVGQIFDGKVSGVADFGIFVEEAETAVKAWFDFEILALISLYWIRKKNYAVIGEKTRKKFSLGDKVRFKVISADMENEHWTMCLCNT